MCGIIGYIGFQNAAEVIYSGLEKLEYRGYDSAGIALLNDGKLSLAKDVGKLRDLKKYFFDNLDLTAPIGIGHTRWATHGRPTNFNAHPHTDGNMEFIVAHNGIIENYLTIKKDLIAKGHVFSTETDTEVIAHLCAEYSQGTLIGTLKKITGYLEGAYALTLISVKEPGLIAVTKKDCPLVIGLGEGENFVASDVTPILTYTRKMVFLEDGQFVEVYKDKISATDIDGEKLELPFTHIDYNPVSAEKAGYSHFMLKEIFEQPNVVRFTIGGRTSEEEGKIYLNELGLTGPQIYNIDRIIFVACGTAYYSALVGKYLLEKLVRIPVEVELGSEFRYKEPIVDSKTLCIAVSQSGETADTLAAIREAKKRGALAIGIINAKGSTLTREVDGILYIHAGPEIGVASTKAYMGMLIAHVLLALYLGKIRETLDVEYVKKIIKELKHIPQQIDEILNRENEIEEIAHKFHSAENFIFLGRGLNLPTALEGALKLKEISYIHAEGYASGELKHGPIALVSKQMPVLSIATDSPVYAKIVSNMKEVSSRDGRLIALATEGNRELEEFVEDIFYIPSCSYELSPLLTVIPLQLLAYHIACLRGADVDQPRNLAKSVTVE
ncbi:glutamine--fructose-6-phosphate transaminase (isomerizing) [Candidatus Riflebacteria bacterium]